MAVKVRRLNEYGIEKFTDWIRGGVIGDIPLELLEDLETSEQISITVEVDPEREFANRYELGMYLAEILKEYNPAMLDSDRGFWSSLALIFFNRLCPIEDHGKREPLKEWCYVLNPDFRHHYRHLLRSPWQLCCKHGKQSRFLLLASNEKRDKLSRHGDILEQLGGRQAVFRSVVLVKEAARLYSDPDSGRPRRGVAGGGGGSVRRLGTVLKQLDLTYDVESMGDGKLLTVLPQEFDRWKS